MKKQLGLFYFCTLVLALSLLFTGCTAGAEPTPVPSATAKPPPTVVPQATVTDTPVPPSATPVPPTATPEPPTATPEPTRTEEPTATASAESTGESETPVAVSAELCMACHGPFAELVAATKDYEWLNGARQSPHMYLPHNSNDLPDCTDCHEVHPQPPTASDIAAMAETEPQFCYTCHHTGDLSCGTCHEIPAGCEDSSTSCGP